MKGDRFIYIYATLLFISNEGHGGSCIIDPRGEVIAGPVIDEETILVVEGSLDLVRSVKSVIDIGGHYSRSDIFSFSVLRRARLP